jgi:hypothetical protein
MIRPDLIFSYWIFIWWILYRFNIVPFNPKFIIILGLLHNLFLLAIKIKYKSKFIPLFIISVTLLKIIPLATLAHTNISNQDIIASVILFIIYIIYIHIIKNNPLHFFYENLQDIIDDKDNTPMVTLLKNITTTL